MEVKTGYKQTEVGVIPEDWELIPLATITDPNQRWSFTGGPFGSNLKSSDYTDEGVRIIQLQNIGDGDFNNDYEIYTSLQKADELLSCNIYPGEIILSKMGDPVARACIIPTHCERYLMCSDGIRLAVDQKRFNTYFVYTVINAPDFRTKAANAGTGSTRKRIGLTELRNLEILCPLLPEQTTIANALSDVDALIESLEQLIAKKRHVKQGAMKELLRPKVGWVEKRLGYLASIQRGASPRPIESPIWFDANSSIGWIRISDVTRSDMYLKETTQRLSSLGVQHSRPISRGSLIMSICATVGRPIITEIDACIHDGFVVFDNLSTDKYFMYYILKSIEGDWSRQGQTGSQMNLNTGLINETKIAVPTKAEQTAIATILSDMDTEIAALETELTKAREIKQGMMQELLTGRIRLI